MNDFARLDADQLRPIIEAFRALKWPATRADIKSVAERLHWEVTSDRESGIDLLAALPLNGNRVDVLLSDECVLKVNIPVSDRVRNIDNDLEPDLRSSFRAIVDDVNVILDGGKTKTPGMRQYHWDFDDSSRLAVENFGAKIVLQVFSPRWANVEREEERQGLDPSRPFDDHQESDM
ncbi:DUF6301 family protein [Rathayibacter iranicus]|uniref:Uncharacterized protein n=1 Tax=Rathayibacter iranicus NCPPB 2253 = VKM Ac-1602 TaxID=1328868 RepID=A0ABX5LC46_9MICO|nr:DUF6301 family protein [Rathayibacter iranicus]PWJ57072.1 hypothetical protein B0H03_1472 [Rathayibacter iranicus NCPPB 2253 = VKM Ac-1602]